jgi:hypothetical protein
MLGQVKAEVGHNGFFIVMGDMFDEQIRLVQRSLTWLVCLNAIYILLTVISMIMTANFRKGREEWQVIVFGQTLFGCFNIVCFTYLLAAFVVNLVIWAALLTLLAGIAFGLFRLVRLR